jgi:prevent-host-death family protein
MQTVNIYDAKTNLSRLLDAVSAGEEVVIARAGKPLARLVPVQPRKPLRQPGFLKGRIKIADDFDAPLPDELVAAFEGR